MTLRSEAQHASVQHEKKATNSEQNSRDPKSPWTLVPRQRQRGIGKASFEDLTIQVVESPDRSGESPLSGRPEDDQCGPKQ